jgi:OOP family OmpA-OmpF porin
MTRRIVTGALVGALAVAFSTGVGAQAYEANPQNSAYVLSVQTPPESNVWRNGTAERLCWRTGYWTPAQAIIACDPDLVPKPPPPRRHRLLRRRRPRRRRLRRRPPLHRKCRRSRWRRRPLFDFDKAVLKPEGMAAIDTEIIAKLRDVQKLELVLVTGHTDRIGTQAYNQKLSERRADAVRNYLVSKGVPRDKIETLGMGKTQPVPGVTCTMTAMKAADRVSRAEPPRRGRVKGEAIKK